MLDEKRGRDILEVLNVDGRIYQKFFLCMWKLKVWNVSV